MRRITRRPGSGLRRAVGAARPRPDDDRGAVAVLVALMSMLFVGLAALVVDHGLTADAQRQAQSAADASALAAAVAMSQGGSSATADAAARAYASANYGVGPAAWGDCTATAVAGYTPMTDSSCITLDAATRTVRVTLPPRAVQSIFGGIYGVSRRAVAGSAAATYGTPGIADCALCVLGLLDGQSGGIQVVKGNVLADVIAFNDANGSIEVTNGDIGYATSYAAVGTYTKDGNPYTPQHVAAVADPYAGIALPPIDDVVPAAASGECTPGTYSDVSACTRFAPGVYVIAGTSKNSDVPVAASGVMFFLTCVGGDGRAHYCTPGQDGATFTAAGKARLAISGLDRPGSPYDRFALFVDPDNGTQQKWTGKADLEVTGVVYDPNRSRSAGRSERGNGQLTVTGRAVLGYLDLKGNGKDKVHVDVTGVPGPGIPAAPTVPRLTQ